MGLRHLVRSATAALRLGWAAAPASLVVTLVVAVADGVVPVAAAWATKVLLDELIRGRSAAVATIVVSVAVIAVAAVVQSAGAAVLAYRQSVLHRSIEVLVAVRLFHRLNAYTGIGVFEEPAALDRIRLAEESGQNAPEEALGAGVRLVQAAITAVGFVAVLALLWSPMIAIVAAVTAPATVLQLRLGPGGPRSPGPSPDCSAGSCSSGCCSPTSGPPRRRACSGWAAFWAGGCCATCGRPTRPSWGWTASQPGSRAAWACWRAG